MQLQEILTFEMELERIISVQTKPLRNKDIITLVKVVWKGYLKKKLLESLKET